MLGHVHTQVGVITLLWQGVGVDEVEQRLFWQEHSTIKVMFGCLLMMIDNVEFAQVRQMLDTFGHQHLVTVCIAQQHAVDKS